MIQSLSTSLFIISTKFITESSITKIGSFSLIISIRLFSSLSTKRLPSFQFHTGAIKRVLDTATAFLYPTSREIEKILL